MYVNACQVSRIFSGSRGIPDVEAKTQGLRMRSIRLVSQTISPRKDPDSDVTRL